MIKENNALLGPRTEVTKIVSNLELYDQGMHAKILKGKIVALTCWH